MAFRIQGLARDSYAQLFGRSGSQLLARGVERHAVTSKPGAPCRITLDDAEIGETVLLLNHLHQPAETPYRQAGPIFVREAALMAFDACDVIPPALAIRLLSVRAYDARGAMIDADVIEGADMPDLIDRFFAQETVAYAQAHYARCGCFAATITRG